LTVERLELARERVVDEPVVNLDFLDRSIRVDDLLGALWRGKWIIIACLITFMAAGFRTYTGLTYTAQMRVVPAESDASQPSSSSSVFSGLGLAGLAGGTVSKFTEFQKSIQSAIVASLLEQRYSVLCTLYSQECDPTTKQWHPVSGFEPKLRGFVKSLLGLPNVYQPRTPIDLVQVLRTRIVMRADGGTVIISFGNSDPKFAVDFLQYIYQTADDYLKLHDRGYLRQYVNYLSAKITTSSLAEREAVQALLLEQERKLMLSEVNVPYAAAILDPPTAFPENPLLPILAIWGGLGLVPGVVLSFLLNYFVPKAGTRRATVVAAR
jgi:hypothetical protein